MFARMVKIFDTDLSFFLLGQALRTEWKGGEIAPRNRLISSREPKKIIPWDEENHPVSRKKSSRGTRKTVSRDENNDSCTISQPQIASTDHLNLLGVITSLGVIGSDISSDS